MPGASSVHAHQRVTCEQGVGHGHVHAGGTCGQQQACGFNQGLARAGHVVEQHHGAPGHGHSGQCNADVAVAVALFDTGRVVPAPRPCGTRHPLQRLFVRPQQQRRRVVLGNQVGQQRRATEHHGGTFIAQRHGLKQGGHAVQVGVHRQHGVEQLGQETTHHTLADHFARVKRDVLPHVAQVRRDQSQPHRAQATCAARNQQQLDQFFIGLVQAAPHHHTRRQFGRQAQAKLAVWKAVALHHMQAQPGCGGGALGDLGFVF